MAADNGKPGTLQAARAGAQLSRRELAERCRVTVAAVGHWETGAHAPLGPARLALAAALGVDPETVDSWFVAPSDVRVGLAARPERAA
ncbi:MAG: helix-turn-helix protein [Planctomycetes bacterium ADurb.Bin069]|jgi:DNA-binding transcriptional regulator YiaG|nr:MAG: helix-turn-helix protein [Planctomycetes bacterium ADurb.Bin069]